MPFNTLLVEKYIRVYREFCYSEEDHSCSIDRKLGDFRYKTDYRVELMREKHIT